MEPEADEELVREFLRAMRADYLARMPAKLAELEAPWQRLRARGWDATAAPAVHYQAHRLHGSGAMDAFAALSAAAQPPDNVVSERGARETPPAESEYAALDALLKEVRLAATACMRMGGEGDDGAA